MDKDEALLRLSYRSDSASLQIAQLIIAMAAENEHLRKRRNEIDDEAFRYAEAAEAAEHERDALREAASYVDWEAIEQHLRQHEHGQHSLAIRRFRLALAQQETDDE